MAGVEVTVQVEGADRLIARLGRAAASQVLRVIVWRAAAKVLTRLKTYPSAPPSSTYMRTGHLGAAWGPIHEASSASGPGVTLSNSIAYGPFVQRDPSQPSPHQAWMHQGRWTTDQQALAAETGPFMREIGDAVESILRG